MLQLLAGCRSFQRCSLGGSVFSLVRSAASSKPNLPDYNTDVEIHKHKLKRPEKPPPKIQPKWTGLDGLEERTKGSLVPETLKQMLDDKDFQATAENLKKFGQAKLTREERKKRQRALDNLGIPDFLDVLTEKKKEAGMPGTERELRRDVVDTLQLNIGIYCNQACSHCHVESSPKRKEMMDRTTADRCLHLLEQSDTITTVDITGGAPELCREFRHLAGNARRMDREVIDRCNLTALLEPGQEDLAGFLAGCGVHVVASLPCYSAKNVNLQRGSGVFDKSIQGLRLLNRVGYGQKGSGLSLDLVYNPLGAYLPPPQKELEDKYREELMENFGIEFNTLYTITNMPIKRFADFLYRRNELQAYMELLVRNFNVGVVDRLMCKNILNVRWDGKIFDCDFNQQMDIPLSDGKKSSGLSVFDIESAEELTGAVVSTDNHCFGCTAGMGSS